MVVFIHALGQPDNYAINWNTLSGIDIFNIIRILGSLVFTQIAVPIFFLISGFLFFIKAITPDWNFYKMQWKKRINTLLIPYVIWNLLKILCVTFLMTLGVIINNNSVSDLFDFWSSVCTWRIFWDINSWGGGQHTLLGQITPEQTGPIIGILWFLRDLIVVVLISPILYWLIRKTKGVVIALLAIIWLLSIDIAIPTQFITASLFFSIGAAFAIYRKEFAETIMKYRKITFVIWVILICFCVYYDGMNSDTSLAFFTPMILVGVFAFIGIIAKHASCKTVSTNVNIWDKIYNYAAQNTFFIYLAHGFLGLHIAPPFINKIFLLLPNTPLFMTIRYLITPFAAIAICFIILYVLNRI